MAKIDKKDWPFLGVNIPTEMEKRIETLLTKKGWETNSHLIRTALDKGLTAIEKEIENANSGN